MTLMTLMTLNDSHDPDDSHDFDEDRTLVGVSKPLGRTRRIVGSDGDGDSEPAHNPPKPKSRRGRKKGEESFFISGNCSDIESSDGSCHQVQLRRVNLDSTAHPKIGVNVKTKSRPTTNQMNPPTQPASTS